MDAIEQAIDYVQVTIEGLKAHNQEGYKAEIELYTTIFAALEALRESETSKPAVALMNKAIDRMSSPAPDEIKIATVLVGLRDFADRADYSPKVMKEKLSECIKDLQALYHADTVTMPRESFEKVKDALKNSERELSYSIFCFENYSVPAMWGAQIKSRDECKDTIEILKQYDVK